MPRSQPAHHKKTHVSSVGGSHLATGVQSHVGHAPIRLGHAQPGVRDPQQDPSLTATHRRYSNRRGRRRIVQRVVDQLGEKMNHGTRRGTDHRAVGHSPGFDAPVVLDLGDGGADHCQQRHRLTVVTRNLRTRQHQQVRTVATQPSGQVIQPEQGVEAVGILLVALQPVDERQLLIHQGPAAPRHGLEHVVDQRSQSRLVPRQHQDLGVQLIDRVRDLTDLLGGVDRQWLRNRLGAPPHLRDLTLEVGVSDLQRTVAQLAQRPDQRTRHQEHHDHRDQDGAQHQHGVANRGVTPSAGPGLHRLGDRLGGVVDDLLGDPAGDLDRLQQLGVTRQHAVRIRDDRHPGHHLLVQGLGVR